MTDVKLSGYKAEAQTAFSGDLDSLGDNNWSALSSEIDTSVNGYMFADLELNLASLIATGADAAVEIYLVPSIDGTTYPDFDVSGTTDHQENNQYFVGSFTLESSGGTFRGSIRGIELPPGKYKLGVRNRANVGLAASGNTLKWRPWQYASA
jgi:hypothetical protein